MVVVVVGGAGADGSRYLPTVRTATYSVVYYSGDGGGLLSILPNHAPLPLPADR